MLLQVARDPNGQTQVPLQVMRTAPGGPDQGQTDRSATGAVATSATVTTTVPLFTVDGGKTAFISDLELYLASGSGTVQLQVGGITVWQAPLSSSTPAIMRRAWPVAAGSGQAVTLLVSTIAGGPNLTFNLGTWEQ